MTDSSSQFVTKLVTNIHNALLFDRSEELEIEVENQIQRRNGEMMGVIDLKITSLTGLRWYLMHLLYGVRNRERRF